MFRDGVWLTELGPLDDGALIAMEVAATLGVERLPGRSMQESLIEYLRSRHALLILDNCEHMLDAAVHLVDGLLRSCPRLQVLATSREALGMAGEVLYRVPSLSVPGPGEESDLFALQEHEAVRLFVERLPRPFAPASRSMRVTAAQWQSSRGGSMGFRWPSNWPPHESGLCLPTSSLPVSTIGLHCSPVAAGPRCLVSRPWRPPWIGVLSF